MKLVSVFTHVQQDPEGNEVQYLCAVLQDEHHTRNYMKVNLEPTAAAVRAWETLEAELRTMIGQRIVESELAAWGDH